MCRSLEVQKGYSAHWIDGEFCWHRTVQFYPHSVLLPNIEPHSVVCCLESFGNLPAYLKVGDLRKPQEEKG